LEQLLVLETMSVRLLAIPGAFEISPQTETTQLTSTESIRKLVPVPPRDYGRWLWHVTPKKSGKHQLTLHVSAGLKDSNGAQTTLPVDDREFTVAVRVQIVQSGVRLGLKFAALVVVALFGAMTQDYWWPKIRAAIQLLNPH
jgi:hypothetical protein